MGNRRCSRPRSTAGPNFFQGYQGYQVEPKRGDSDKKEKFPVDPLNWNFGFSGHCIIGSLKVISGGANAKTKQRIWGMNATATHTHTYISLLISHSFLVGRFLYEHVEIIVRTTSGATSFFFPPRNLGSVSKSPLGMTVADPLAQGNSLNLINV